MSDLAGVLADLGHVDEAEGLNRRAVAMELAAGVDPNAALTRHNYASFLRKMARYDEAESLERQVYQAWNGGNSANPQPGQAYAAQCLGLIHLETNRLDEAERLLTEADATWRALLGDDAVRRTAALAGLGRVDFLRGRYVEAAARLRQAYDLSERHQGAAAAETLLARLDWLRVRDGVRPTPDTLAEMQATLAQLLPQCAAVRRDTARAINTLAELLLTASPPSRSSAEPLLAEALRLETEAGMEHHPTRAETLRLMAAVGP